MRTALTIAGSDSSGGAGIQADIKTMSAHGIYAMSAVTALTAQNTTGVTDTLEATPSFLAAELDAVFTDIFPDAVKIGMVSSADLITVIALIPYTPFAIIVFKSAWMPAPPLESLPAIVNAVFIIKTPFRHQ